MPTVSSRTPKNGDKRVVRMLGSSRNDIGWALPTAVSQNPLNDDRMGDWAMVGGAHPTRVWFAQSEEFCGIGILPALDLDRQDAYLQRIYVPQRLGRFAN